MRLSPAAILLLLLATGCGQSRQAAAVPSASPYHPLAVRPHAEASTGSHAPRESPQLAEAPTAMTYRTSSLLPPRAAHVDESPAPMMWAPHHGPYRLPPANPGDHEPHVPHAPTSQFAVGRPPPMIRQVTELQEAGLPPLPESEPISPRHLRMPAATQLPVPPMIMAAQHPVPIDLATALQLTAGRNPQVAFAQERIQEAYARLQIAEAMWIPSLRAGVNYNKHEGRIQDVVGEMIETSRGSIYSGLGAGAVGAGSPAIPGLVMNFHLRDAIFQPEIAGQAVGARRHASRAVMNNLLLDTALAYMDLLEAAQVRAIAQETHDNARQLANLADDYAQAGQGLQSDAARARTELAIREVELRRAEESYRVAAVRLTRLLSRDQSQLLVPQEVALVPIELITIDTSPNELVATGLTNRPELAENQYLVGEAVQRVRREQYAPLVPSVLLGLSYGGNAGGLGGNLENFGDRLDFDAMAFWELRNLGVGERAYRAEACSVLQQMRWRQVQVMDQVAADVAEAHVQVMERREQIRSAEAAIQTASDSHIKNLDRIRDGQGLPIEALQSIQALDQARRLYTRVVADYNRAQFRLHRALGWPIE